ncbi:MAG: hypothetical protein A3E88_01990 [Legionellales bacterium RIFCSPHIGHO2_12_FULL_35_11]|nr:MAG: hypothetical protein A3E88_01990 [Legionellales bacterium RIFCSPHIGHO2_12_FULL_35_11]
MRPLHIFIAIIVAASWGINFIFVKFGLTELPPLLLCALRFLFASIPAVFFIQRPSGNLKLLIYYSLFTFAIQFSLLFFGLHLGMPAGLSSLVFQIQIFFNIFLAAIFFQEIPTKIQITGAIIAFTGIAFAMIDINQSSTILGFILVFFSALSWSFGNLFAKKINAENTLSLVAWGCLISMPITFFLSYLIEGPSLILTSIQHISWIGIGSIAYATYISTGVGYVLWSILLKTYPISSVIPFTLLIPIFGYTSSMLVFHESFSNWKIIATFLIILGLSINIFGPKILLKSRGLREAAIN